MILASSACLACAGSYRFCSVWWCGRCIFSSAQPALLCLFSIGIQPRQRHIAAWFVHVADDGAAPALLDQPHAFRNEGSGTEAVVFGNAPPYGVVVKARDQPKSGDSQPNGSSDTLYFLPKSRKQSFFE